MSTLDQKLLKECIEIYGREKVDMIRELVYVSDPDGVWAMMGDMDDEEGQAIVEMLYFEN